MKRKRIVVMYALLALITLVVLLVSVPDAKAGIPGRVVNCKATWKVFFRAQTLIGSGQIVCTRPVKMMKGRISLLRIKLGGDQEVGSGSPQASAHDDFFRTQVAVYVFQVSHVCQPTDTAVMWWLTIQTTTKEKSWSKPDVRANFSHTVITDCG